MLAKVGIEKEQWFSVLWQAKWFRSIRQAKNVDNLIDLYDYGIRRIHRMAAMQTKCIKSRMWHGVCGTRQSSVICDGTENGKNRAKRSSPFSVDHKWNSASRPHEFVSNRNIIKDGSRLNYSWHFCFFDAPLFVVSVPLFCIHHTRVLLASFIIITTKDNQRHCTRFNRAQSLRIICVHAAKCDQSNSYHFRKFVVCIAIAHLKEQAKKASRRPPPKLNIKRNTRRNTKRNKQFARYARPRIRWIKTRTKWNPIKIK